MLYKNGKKIASGILGSILALGIVVGDVMAATNAGASVTATPQHPDYPRRVGDVTLEPHIERTKTREPDTMKMETHGGFSYVNPQNDDYWAKVSGVLRFDDSIFSGSYRDKQFNFPNGARVRKANVGFDGGIGPNIEFTIGLDFDFRNFTFSDVWLAYDGIVPWNEIFVGRVPGYFYGLDNANSTMWNPFLERSRIADAFFPGDGYGVMTDFFGDHWGLTLVASQPVAPLLRIVRLTNQTVLNPPKNAHWRGIARLTVAPCHEKGNVWHFGISGAYRENARELTGGIATGPGAAARRNEPILIVPVPTGNINDFLNLGRAAQFAVEFARQCGPWMLEAEYQSFTLRSLPPAFFFTRSARFHGWYVQTRFLLTGGVHEYDVRDGGFGKVTNIPPCACGGAWEVAARYDFINLTDKNVLGGSAHNVTLGLNWYVTEYVRLSTNYIRANIHPASIFSRTGSALPFFATGPDALQQRHLDIISFRAQLRFK